MCGHCGYSMGVQYGGRSWTCACSAPDPDSGLPRGCLSAGGKRIDHEVARLFLERAAPAGAEAALQPAAEAAAGAEAGLRHWEQALQHCRCEARLAERRYRQVDPDNRLVATTLERDWEQAERALRAAGQALALARAGQPEPPPPEFFAELGACLPRVWHAPTTSSADRKRLLGCLLEQVALEHSEEEGRITASVEWRGGLVDELEFPKIVPAPQQALRSPPLLPAGEARQHPANLLTGRLAARRHHLRRLVAGCPLTLISYWKKLAAARLTLCRQSRIRCTDCRRK